MKFEVRNMGIKKFWGLALTTAFAILISTGCTTGSGPGAGLEGQLGVTPASPVYVKVGETEQFSLSSPDESVQWTVAGGADNGTISDAGLYTAPSKLPVNTTVKINVTTSDSSGEVEVHLLAGDKLTWGEARNTQGVVSPDALFSFATTPVGNKITVREGSLEIAAVWSQLVGYGPPQGTQVPGQPPPKGPPILNTFFSHSRDLGPFESPLTVFESSTDPNYATAVLLDSELNPAVFSHVVYPGGSEAGIQVKNSLDGGGISFGEAHTIVGDANNIPYLASPVIDQNNHFHITWSQSSISKPTPTLMYSKSEDSGANWSDPVPIAGGEAGVSVMGHLAVDPSGQRIAVCFISGTSQQVKIAHSEDGGQTWDSNFVTNNDKNHSSCQIRIGAEKEIYMSYSAWDANQWSLLDLYFVKSSDEGQTFSEPVPVATGLTNSSISVFHNMAVDPIGRIHIFWPDDKNSAHSWGNVISFASSNNGGLSFSEPGPFVGGEPNDVAGLWGITTDGAGRLYVLYYYGDQDPNNSASQYPVFVKIAE